MDSSPVTIPGSPPASVLGFGCAPLGGRVGPKQARRALELAWDLGVRYFDTARSYGYGESERILGAFARGKRDRMVIGSKAGIRVARPSLARRFAKGAARKVFEVAPSLRERLRGRLGGQHKRGLFSAEDVRLSVEESLRELRTSYIDMLFLHECPLELLERDEVFEVLTRFQERGLVRAWGLSAEAEVIAAALGGLRPEVGGLQYRSNLLEPGGRWPSAGAGIFRVANQPFGGGAGLRAITEGLRALASAPDTPAELAHKLRAPSASVDVALGVVRYGPGSPIVLCSMTTPAHVQANVRVVERSAFTPAELARIQRSFEARGG